MGKLTSLPNIGSVIETQLQAAGISTPEELACIGSHEAFIRIRQHDNTACLHLLYALQGAVEGIRYTMLSNKTKNELKQFFHWLQ